VTGKRRATDTVRGVFSRMRRGWDLTKKAWAVIRSHPGLARLPLYGGLLALVAALVFAVPGAILLADDGTGTAGKVIGVVLIAIGAYLASFLVVYYNVALAAGADQALRGEQPDIAAARAVARSRIGLIAQWALISAVVSAVLSVVRQETGAVGDIIAGIGGAIWSLVTFLVVPVLAFEGISPVAAMKRSAHLFRERWGQQVTGNIVIGGVGGLVVLAGVLLGALGVVLLAAGNGASEVFGGFLLLVGVVLAVAGSVFTGAARGVFGVALYRYVAENQAMGPFTTQDLESAARTR
jgi:hypothetical protein